MRQGCCLRWRRASAEDGRFRSQPIAAERWDWSWNLPRAVAYRTRLVPISAALRL